MAKWKVVEGIGDVEVAGVPHVDGLADVAQKSQRRPASTSRRSSNG